MKSYYNMMGFNSPRPMMSDPNGTQGRYRYDWNVFGDGGGGGRGRDYDQTYRGGDGRGGAGRKWWQDGGSGESPWGGGQYRDNPYGHDALYRLAQILYGGAAGSSAFNADWAEPRFQKTLMDAYGLIGPAGAAVRTGQFKKSALQGALSSGSQQASQLRAMGFSPAAQAGVMTNAHNKALEDSNEFWQEHGDPMAQAAQKLKLLSQAGESPTMSMIMKLFGLGASKQEQKSPSLFESILGGLGTAFSGGWKPFK